ncbi:unnamed protein product [Mytilus edulis]|uniref:Heat shock 70 kDa protein 12B n=1 Tax=Mytilus edulis TaxID=6550 RepID=A0A8S3R218_MYTED|nr:unnamed protein product [Mytilus edulis]
MHAWLILLHLLSADDLIDNRQYVKVQKPWVFCAAIDIGTTYSGYAFSSKAGYAREPLTMYTSVWDGCKLFSLKTPTAVLLDSSQEFVAFGFEAEKTYSDLLAEEEHEDYYYFHSFKMLLYEKRITRNLKIKDVHDKEMEALKVFQCAIRFLKDRFLKTLSDRVKSIEEDDVFFVLTVPAIWDDSARQFMREAATMVSFWFNPGFKSFLMVSEKYFIR